MKYKFEQTKSNHLHFYYLSNVVMESFFDWLKENKVKCDHVEIFDFPETGRGMVKLNIYVLFYSILYFYFILFLFLFLFYFLFYFIS
jgi:hypothetical protein